MITSRILDTARRTANGFALAIAFSVSAFPSAAADATVREMTEMAELVARQQIHDRFGTDAQALTIRIGISPLPNSSDGQYVAIDFSPGDPGRNPVRYVAAAIALPSLELLDLATVVPPEHRAATAKAIASALIRALGEDEIPAQRAREAGDVAMGQGSALTTLEPPTLWTSLKDRTPTLHVAFPGCGLVACKRGVVEVTLPAAWATGQRTAR